MSNTVNSVGNPAPAIQTSSSTGTGAIALACSPTVRFRLLNITVHAASAVASTVSVTLDSGKGSTYDTVLYTSGANWTDLYWVMDESEVFEYNDAINVTCADASIVKTVVIRWEIL
jgi:hypothetical protein